MSTGYVTAPKLCYQKPSIGPRNYLAVGASGWVETFPRGQCDKQLAGYIGDVPLEELVGNFVEQRSVDEAKKTHWHHVTGYLARIFQTKPDAVPIGVGVAFWAKAVIAGADQ